MRRIVLLAILCCAGSAYAKERTGGCAGFPRAFLRIENAIRIGAPTWNKGNQLLTYAIYRDTIQSILSELVKDDSCGRVHGYLASALEKARKERTMGTAGWDLRHGFDAFMETVAKGDAPKLPPEQEVTRQVAPYYDRDCPDLFSWVLRAEKSHGVEDAKKMLSDLRAQNACPRVVEALAAGIKRKDPDGALERLANGEPPPGDPDEPPAILRRCTAAPVLVEQITFAVVRGAPRYDEGHPDVCLDIYKKTAEDLITRYGAGGRCAEATGMLKKGLAEAKKAGDVSKAAWALRHAFDAVGEAFVRAVPQ